MVRAKKFFLLTASTFVGEKTSFKYFCLVNIKYFKKINCLEKSNNDKAICFYDINE